MEEKSPIKSFLSSWKVHWCSGLFLYSGSLSSLFLCSSSLFSEKNCACALRVPITARPLQKSFLRSWKVHLCSNLFLYSGSLFLSKKFRSCFACTYHSRITFKSFLRPWKVHLCSGLSHSIVVRSFLAKCDYHRNHAATTMQKGHTLLRNNIFCWI